MIDLTSDRLRELIKIHEANFQKHLLGLNSTDNLFQYCIEYIDHLEKRLLDYNRRKHFGKLRCNAVDEGKHCENVAVKRVSYKGDPQIYKKRGIPVSVFIVLCSKHHKRLKGEQLVEGIDYFD
ncbi:MAG: hypothetical protein KGI19_11020 [Thaumarchaeota archaeon]|nr:hypothetical protein [Nitrososphaerota archaeon]